MNGIVFMEFFHVFDKVASLHHILEHVFVVTRPLFDRELRDLNFLAVELPPFTFDYVVAAVAIWVFAN